MNERLKSNFIIALEALVSNRTRSLLTALGIIFGVAAVIAMLAIGKGAEQEILEQVAAGLPAGQERFEDLGPVGIDIDVLEEHRPAQQF